MHLDPSRFTVHDVTAFPFVVFNHANATPGYADRWEAEMVALVAHGEPFVIVYDGHAAEEHDDRRHRGIWLKHNKGPLAGVCKALISIEPDDIRRAGIEAIGATAVKAFGIPHEAVASRDDARLLAMRLTQPHATPAG